MNIQIFKQIDGYGLIARNCMYPAEIHQGFEGMYCLLLQP